MEPRSITVKASFGDDLRRWSADSASLTYPSLVAAVQERFSLDQTCSPRLQWKDDDGDLVVLAQQDDLVEALRECGGTVRLTVTANHDESHAQSQQPTQENSSTPHTSAHDFVGMAASAAQQFMQSNPGLVAQAQQFAQQAAQETAPQETPAASNQAAGVPGTVKEIKAMLTQLGVPYEGILEKSELQQLLAEALENQPKQDSQPKQGTAQFEDFIGQAAEAAKSFPCLVAQAQQFMQSSAAPQFMQTNPGLFAQAQRFAQRQAVP